MRSDEMRTKEEQEAYMKACSLMNIALVEFGGDIKYKELPDGWVLIHATEEALAFIIDHARGTGVHFRMRYGQLKITI